MVWLVGATARGAFSGQWALPWVLGCAGFPACGSGLRKPLDGGAASAGRGSKPTFLQVCDSVPKGPMWSTRHQVAIGSPPKLGHLGGSA